MNHRSVQKFGAFLVAVMFLLIGSLITGAAATVQKPVFNTNTDNPNVGDEREFLRIAKRTDNGVALKDYQSSDFVLEPNENYTLMFCVDNCASPALGDASIAKDTTLQVVFPTHLAAGESVDLKGTIISSNANPKFTEASITVSAAKDLELVVTGKTIDRYDKVGAYLGQKARDAIVNKIENTHLVVAVLGDFPAGYDQSEIIFYDFQTCSPGTADKISQPASHGGDSAFSHQNQPLSGPKLFLLVTAAVVLFGSLVYLTIWFIRKS